MSTDDDIRESWSTNKADLWRRGGHLSKHYRQRGSAERDAMLLQVIEQHYQPVTLEGWSYRALQVHGVDSSGDVLTMEFVPGDSLVDLFRSTGEPSLFRHAGRWLGRLHAGGFEQQPGRVVTFNDFNSSNVIIDHVARQVVAIDPGAFQQVSASPGVSLIMGALSAGRNTLRSRPRLVVRSVLAYLAGYLEGTGADTLPRLGPGWRHAMERVADGRSRTFVTRGPRAVRVVCGVIEFTLWAVLTRVCALTVVLANRRR